MDGLLITHRAKQKRNARGGNQPMSSDANRANLLRRINATMIGVKVMISQTSSGARKNRFSTMPLRNANETQSNGKVIIGLYNKKITLTNKSGTV